MTTAERTSAYATLVQPGETPEAALLRLEKRPDYLDVMKTDAGQALVVDCWRRANAARRAKGPIG
jgi:hypothetical protein